MSVGFAINKDVIKTAHNSLRHSWFLCLFIYCASATLFKSGNACYYSVQNILSSNFPSQNLNIKIYRAIILPVVLYGYETWSLTFREERRLRLYENSVLRRLCEPKRARWQGSGENYIMRSLLICTPHQILFG